MSAVTLTNVTKTVATAGTRVQFTTDTTIQVSSVYIEALGTNAGVVYVGLSDVSSTKYITKISASAGFPLAPDVQKGIRFSGQTIQLSTLYVDAANSGDKIQVTYIPAT